MSTVAGKLPSLATVRGATCVYPDGTRALLNFDFELTAGELCVAVGANGSGKSTLLRVVALDLPPTSGEVQLFGLSQATPRRVASRLQWLTQEPALDPEMTAREHLELQAALMKVPAKLARERVARLAEAFELGDAMGRLVSGHSGGMRKRLHLALGLLTEPELLLLDEPTAGLDMPGRQHLWSVLRARTERGQTSLVVSHDLEAASRHASRIVMLERGRLVAEGTPDQIAQAGGGSLAAAFAQATGRDVESLQPARTPGRPARRQRDLGRKSGARCGARQR